jgi:hypothetical protein
MVPALFDTAFSVRESGQWGHIAIPVSLTGFMFMEACA